MNQRLKSSLGRMRVFWASMLGMQLFLLVALLAGIIPEQTKPMPRSAPLLLGVVSITGALLALRFPSVFLVEKLRELDVKIAEEVVVDPERAVVEAIQRLSMHLVRSWSLPVVIAMCGFYLGVQRVPMVEWLPFFAAGIAVALTQFPTLSKIAKLIERAKGARCELKP